MIEVVIAFYYSIERFDYLVPVALQILRPTALITPLRNPSTREL